MSGRVVAAIIVLVSLLAGGGLYYAQVYAFYGPVQHADTASITLQSADGTEAREVPVNDLETIDKTSSPLGYRACFVVPNSLAMMTETYALVDGAEPLQAPGWFECFDAAEIGLALEEGRALAFMGTPEVADWVDRVIAVMDDGRGFAWHQLNDKYRD